MPNGIERVKYFVKMACKWGDPVACCPHFIAKWGKHLIFKCDCPDVLLDLIDIVPAAAAPVEKL